MHNRSKPRRGTPESIIARLYALADLAEQAAYRVWIVRVFVLWVLRHAEAVAYDYVLQNAWDAGLYDLSEQLACDLAAAEDEDSASEALRLAFCFRALAMTLTYLSVNGLLNEHDTGHFRPSIPQTRRKYGAASHGRRASAGRAELEFAPAHWRPEVRLALAGLP